MAQRSGGKLPFRRSHTLMDREAPLETQQGQVHGPAPQKEEPGASLKGGGQPAEKQLC